MQCTLCFGFKGRATRCDPKTSRNATEARVFDGNGRAQCATSIPSGLGWRGERTEPQSSSPKALQLEDCDGIRQRNSGSMGTSQADFQSMFPFPTHSAGLPYSSCNGASRCGGSKRAYSHPNSTLGRTRSQPLEGRRQSATRWREISALLIRTIPIKANQPVSAKLCDIRLLAISFGRAARSED